MPRIRCPNSECQQTLRLPKDNIPQSARCPKCSRQITIPDKIRNLQQTVDDDAEPDPADDTQADDPTVADSNAKPMVRFRKTVSLGYTWLATNIRKVPLPAFLTFLPRQYPWIRQFITDRVYGLLRQDVRLPLRTQDSAVESEGNEFTIQLHRGCVNCTKRSGLKKSSMAQRVYDLETTIRLIALGLIIVIASWLLWKSLWISLTAFVLSLWGVYGFTPGHSVKVRFFRCKAHADSTDYPKLRLWQETFVIRLANDKVSQQFRDRDKDSEFAGESSDSDETEFIGWIPPDSSAEPENSSLPLPTMPLAEIDENEATPIIFDYHNEPGERPGKGENSALPTVADNRTNEDSDEPDISV